MSTIQPMPEDVKEALMALGFDADDAELVGELGQKIRDYVVSEISEDDTVPVLGLIIGAYACKMTGAFFEDLAKRYADA